MGVFLDAYPYANGVNLSPELHRTPALLTPKSAPAATAAIGVSAAVVVVVFGLLAARTAPVTHFDLVVSQALNSLHTGPLGVLGSAAYVIFGPAPAIAVTLVIAAVMWVVSRNLRVSVTFGAVVAVTWLPSAVVKLIVDRPRPNPALLSHPFASQPVDASYPSGHAVFVTALVVALVLLTRGRAIRPLVTVLGGLLVALVVFLLVVDGVHYLTDVLASVLWSIGLAPLVLEVWNRVVLPRTYRRRPTVRKASE